MLLLFLLLLLASNVTIMARRKFIESNISSFILFLSTIPLYPFVKFSVTEVRHP